MFGLSRSFLLRMRNVSDKRREYPNRHFIFIGYFLEPTLMHTSIWTCMSYLYSCSSWKWACQGPKHVEDNVTYMFILKCALKLVLKISYTMMHGRKNIKFYIQSFDLENHAGARQKWQYGACALLAHYLRLQTHIYSMWYLLPFHRNNGCTNTPQCYVIRTSRVSLVFQLEARIGGPVLCVAKCRSGITDVCFDCHKHVL